MTQRHMGLSRLERRRGIAIETTARRSGRWGEVEWRGFPKGSVSPDPASWAYHIGEGAEIGGWLTVLLRDFRHPSGIGVMWHLCIQSPSAKELKWREKMHLLDILGFSGRCAIEVCPPADRVIDAADSFHLWVYPQGFELGFGLHADDVGRPAP